MEFEEVLFARAVSSCWGKVLNQRSAYRLMAWNITVEQFRVGLTACMQQSQSIWHFSFSYMQLCCLWIASMGVSRCCCPSIAPAQRFPTVLVSLAHAAVLFWELQAPSYCCVALCMLHHMQFAQVYSAWSEMQKGGGGEGLICTTSTLAWGRINFLTYGLTHYIIMFSLAWFISAKSCSESRLDSDPTFSQ
jgi:hypothetical protein